MIFETRRLRLREFRTSDLEPYLELRSNSEFLRYYEGEEKSPSFTRRLLKSFINGAREEPRRVYQMAVEQENRLVGTCGIRLDRTDLSRAWFGVEIDADYWRQGFATEAGRTMLTFARRELGITKIYAETTPDNHRSRNMLAKLGMKALKTRVEDGTVIYRLPVEHRQAV